MRLELSERRMVYARTRTAQAVERWRRQRIIDVAPEAEASLVRWVLTGKADDPLESRINPPAEQ